MKKTVLFSVPTLIFCLMSVLLFGQNNYSDVVYLKNGSIIKGVIIEQVPNKSLKIQTSDNNVYEYQYENIEKVAKEQIQSQNLPAKESKKGIRIGFRAGINFATWSNVDVDPMEMWVRTSGSD